MKNFSQLSLFFLAALTVGQSVAEDMSFPLFNRALVANGNPGLGKRQGPTVYTCDTGFYQCADGLGCCETGTQCEVGTAKCLKPCGAGSTTCYDSCCDAGYACVGPNQPCLKVDTLPASTTSKVMTPGTPPVTASTTSTTGLANPYPTMPMGSSSKPVYPPTATGGYSSGGSSPNNTVSSKNATSSMSVIPLSGSSALNPAGWLGGFGIAFFLVFFNM